jgi:2-hydroxycyclohexanecarboxyl-CoA dehydrogenase
VKRLANKVALVLGASAAGNIGQAIARRFAAEGAKVMVAGRSRVELAKLSREIGGLNELCDITSESDLFRLVSRTIETLGGIDIAVNATGRNHRRLFLQTTRADLAAITDVQFIGPILFMQAVIRAMKRLRAGGSIIQISSVTSTVMLHDHALYMGTKAGIDHVVRAVAYDHGVDGIRVNSISPGPTVDAPMAADYFKDPTVVEKMKLMFPLRRIGSTADVADAALWLASDECFMTGQLLQVNGGLTLLAPSD